jgi:hypothetical protein
VFFPCPELLQFSDFLLDNGIEVNSDFLLFSVVFVFSGAIPGPSFVDRRSG